ncbi:MAG: redoxin domain-containing protein [Gemmataceae bacterium]
MSHRTIRLVGLTVIAVIAVGVGYVAYTVYGVPPLKDEADFFKERPETNAQVSQEQFQLTFVDSDGKSVDLIEYRGKKIVMLVFMRGYPGEICPNCSAQTSRLIRNHAEFVKRDTEVLMVFPGPKEHLDKLIAAGRARADNAVVPFRILLDPDFVAVDKLGIRGSLAKPSTYILDKQGRVRFAYVGAYTTDRPSVKGMLDQIDRLKDERIDL